MKKMNIQGDVAVVAVKLPVGTKKGDKGSEVLALGEHSGHGHVAENCEVLIGADDMRYLVPKKDARILHKHLLTGGGADHRELLLPALEEGWAYRVITQNEYNPEEGIFNQVID
jgi:hypothetical protein